MAFVQIFNLWLDRACLGAQIIIDLMTIKGFNERFYFYLEKTLEYFLSLGETKDV
jgi:hypothetical protein